VLLPAINQSGHELLLTPWLVGTERVRTIAGSTGLIGLAPSAFGVDTTSHAILEWPAQVGPAYSAVRGLTAASWSGAIKPLDHPAQAVRE
jgi:predicted dehydrogenase